LINAIPAAPTAAPTAVTGLSKDVNAPAIPDKPEMVVPICPPNPPRTFPNPFVVAETFFNEFYAFLHALLSCALKFLSLSVNSVFKVAAIGNSGIFV